MCAQVRRQTDFTDEDYVPPGILKRNWVPKHKNVIPSVVVAFFDLEWQDENWTDREAHCAKVIDELRSAMNGRLTRLVVRIVCLHCKLHNQTKTKVEHVLLFYHLTTLLVKQYSLFT